MAKYDSRMDLAPLSDAELEALRLDVYAELDRMSLEEARAIRIAEQTGVKNTDWLQRLQLAIKHMKALNKRICKELAKRWLPSMSFESCFVSVCKTELPEMTYERLEGTAMAMMKGVHV